MNLQIKDQLARHQLLNKDLRGSTWLAWIGFAVLVVVALTGCATLSNPNSIPVIRTSATLACGSYLTFGVKDDAQRHLLAVDIFTASTLVSKLSAGTVPTAADVKAAVLQYGGSEDQAKYASFASALSSLYGSYYAKLQGNPKLAADVLNAISAGCADAANAYLPASASAFVQPFENAEQVFSMGQVSGFCVAKPVIHGRGIDFQMTGESGLGASFLEGFPEAFQHGVTPGMLFNFGWHAFTVSDKWRNAQHSSCI